MAIKSTGIVRKVDELGRIVLPKELRNTMRIAQKDPLEIYVEGESIVLRKYSSNDENIANENGSFVFVATGIVRNVDELGRIVLPKELRGMLRIGQKDPLEIFVENDTIILRKYEPACIFCDDVADVISFKGKKVCKNCISELAEI